jgi:hypothetical protein
MDETEIQEKIKKGYLRVKMIVEIAGFPEEHVKKTLGIVREKALEVKGVEEIKTQIREPKKISERMWSGFVEFETMMDSLPTLIGLSFDFMPSSIEIIEPESISADSGVMSDVLNDLAARLHQYDAIAKMLRAKLAMKEKENKA